MSDIPDWIKTEAESNVVVYVGSKEGGDQIFAALKEVWGERSDCLMLHAVPEMGQTADVLRRGERGIDFNNVSYKLLELGVPDIGYIITEKDAIDSSAEEWASALRIRHAISINNFRKYGGSRRRNMLENLKSLEGSIDPASVPKAFHSEFVNIWLAGPSLDIAIDAIGMSEDGWDKMNNAVNLVADSAISALEKTPLRIDMAMSIEGTDLKSEFVPPHIPLLAWGQTNPGTVQRNKQVVFGLNHNGISGAIDWDFRSYMHEAEDCGQALWAAAKHFWPNAQIMLLGADLVFFDEAHHHGCFDLPLAQAPDIDVECRDMHTRKTTAGMMASIWCWHSVLGSERADQKTWNCSETGAPFGRFLGLYEWLRLLEDGLFVEGPLEELPDEKRQGIREVSADVVKSTELKSPALISNQFRTSAALLDPLRWCKIKNDLISSTRLDSGIGQDAGRKRYEIEMNHLILEGSDEIREIFKST